MGHRRAQLYTVTVRAQEELPTRSLCCLLPCPLSRRMVLLRIGFQGQHSVIHVMAIQHTLTGERQRRFTHRTLLKPTATRYIFKRVSPAITAITPPPLMV